MPSSSSDALLTLNPLRDVMLLLSMNDAHALSATSTTLRALLDEQKVASLGITETPVAASLIKRFPHRSAKSVYLSFRPDLENQQELHTLGDFEQLLPQKRHRIDRVLRAYRARQPVQREERVRWIAAPRRRSGSIPVMASTSLCRLEARRPSHSSMRTLAASRPQSC